MIPLQFSYPMTIPRCPTSIQKIFIRSIYHVRALRIPLNLWLSRCQCTDNCGSSPVDGAIFRKDTALEAFLRSDDLYKRLGSKFFRGLYISNLIALVLIGAYGIVGLFQIQLSPAEVRRRLFSRFTHATLKSQQHTFQTRFLYHLGKWVAASVYLLTILVAIICPLVFISSIVVNEMVAWGYPASEAADAIGQVSPFS